VSFGMGLGVGHVMHGGSVSQKRVAGSWAVEERDGIWCGEASCRAKAVSADGEIIPEFASFP
jgi:triosephosphate isomerase